MKTWLKIFLAVIIIGIIGVVLVYKFVYNKPHTDYSTANAAYTLNVRELFDAYIASPDTAMKKYNGQIIELKGTPDKIEITDSLVIAVFVFKQGEFGDEGVRCTMLREYNEAAKKQKPGSIIRVKGYCTGFSGDVILEKCSILNP